jgi:hypothetical protein
MLVQNDADAAASVKGTFIYQRKTKSQTWEDMPAASLGTLKASDEYRLELHSSEVLTLFTELTGLYELHRNAGIPIGKTKYIRANQTLESLSKMTDDEFSGVLSGTESLGVSGIARLIQWASSADNFRLLFDRLQALEPNSLRNLNAALGITELKKALITWRKNRDTGDEAVWQSLLSSQTFVLEQIFSVPIVVIQEKAYVGGKSISNTGGHIVDFLFKNAVSRGVGLVEIKTPKTLMLGAEYRAGVYNISTELTGAIQQILTYRQSLVDERDTLLRHQPGLESFNPRCVVLIGHLRHELDTKTKRQAFELFRGQQSDVEIITFDEMYERTERLIDVLEGNTDQ